jgi:hypothetical protein
MAAATWQGTDEEFARLEQAVAHNCDCVVGTLDLPPLTCPAHLMLGDQTTLDHLLYVYRTRQGFITREFYAVPVRAISTSRQVRSVRS